MFSIGIFFALLSPLKCPDRLKLSRHSSLISVFKQPGNPLSIPQGRLYMTLAKRRKFRSHINMLGFVWLLAAVAVLGTLYDLPAWETYLQALDSSLPRTTASNGKVCYYFDVAQTCSADAISAWLHLSPVINVLTWTPTAADCSKLLDKQRLYLETTASSLFGFGGIATASAAGVTNFEQLAQSWILQVGYFPLTTKYADFTAAINSIVDWKTVKCDGANLIYDGKSITKPDFLAAGDCTTLGSVFVEIILNPCDFDTDAYCLSVEVGQTCCLASMNSVCCKRHASSLGSDCGNLACTRKDFCCASNPSSSCCTGTPGYCGTRSCTPGQGETCCIADGASECCQAQYPGLNIQCTSDPGCDYQPYCCHALPNSMCCKGLDWLNYCRKAGCSYFPKCCTLYGNSLPCCPYQV